MTTTPVSSDTPAAWHAVPLVELFASLETSRNGLSIDQARARLREVGANTIPRGAPASVWRVLLAQFRSVVILLLVIACVVAGLVGDLADTVAIAAVLLLNVGLGFALEIRAHRAIEALGRLEARRATVIREGVPREIDAAEVVPGDILLLEAGQSVPADARLVTGTELRVVEATLTGESVPVGKLADAPVDAGASVPERRNSVFAGTTIASGTARALVTATGANTELGKIGSLVTATKVEKTPLERRLDMLGRQLVWIALAVGAITGVMAWINDAPSAQVLQAAIALAVAAVPEGLPAVATITLALGVHRMARRRALVRRLPAVETLGAVTILCTDKTGTLTAGAMTVTEIRTAHRVYRVTGTGYAPDGAFFLGDAAALPQTDPDLLSALRIGATVNRADAMLSDGTWVAHGDPTEAALVVAARKAGIERADVVRERPETADVPFSSHRAMMATFHRSEGDPRVVAYVKGAPQRVLRLCTTEQVSGGIQPLDSHRLDALMASNHDMAARGLRVLAVAYGDVARAEESALAGLVFVGLVGMNDPPAPGVKDAIRAFAGAGVTTVMITGDQAGTAQAVARDLGLVASGTLDGRQVDALSDDALRSRLGDVSVFSRVSPEAKLRIVAAYQARGDIVAMIGDGVNDAAALRKADVGVTMGGRGSDVARETSAVVLQDDRFETIGVAMEEGRVVFDNIRKFVFYLFSCNLAEIIVLLGTSAAGLPLPLEPIQVLWLNLVTDTAPALALALEPAEPGVMSRPPRDPAAAIVSWSFLRHVSGYAVLIAASALVIVVWTSVTGVPARRAMTMTFMALALAQLFHLGNARDARAVVTPDRALANPAALWAVVIVVCLQLAAVYVDPVARLLHVEPLGVFEWSLVLAAGAVPGVAGQTVKLLRGRVHGAASGEVTIGEREGP